MLQKSKPSCRPSAVDVDVPTQIQRSIEGDVSHLWLSGDIDMAVVQPLLSIVADEPRCGTCRVHTGDVTFFDAAGLRALTLLQRHIVDQEAVFELDAGPSVSRVLRIVDPNDELFTHPTTHDDAAVAPPDSSTQSICGRVEPVGTDGEWMAECDFIDPTGIGTILRRLDTGLIGFQHW